MLSRKKRVSTGGAWRGRGPSAYTQIVEITSGTTHCQQGLAATCEDQVDEQPSKAGWRHWVGRMSQYERRRPGNAGRGDARRLPEAGNACFWQRGSRQVADGRTWLRLDIEPGSASLRPHRRAEGITGQLRGVRGQALEPRVVREGPSGRAAAANRTREIRPSGMSPHGRLPTPMDETGGVLGYASGAGSTQARSLSGVTNPWMSLGSARWTPNCRRASTLA